MRSLLIVELPSILFGLITAKMTEGISGIVLTVFVGVLVWVVLCSNRIEMTSRLRAQVAKEAGDPDLACRLGIRPSDIGKVGPIWMWSMSSKSWLEERRLWHQAYEKRATLQS